MEIKHEDRGSCLRENRNLQKTRRRNQEENQDSIMACTTQKKKKKKKTFKVAGPSMSNVDTSLKTMEAVLQSQYSGGHGVVIVRL